MYKPQRFHVTKNLSLNRQTCNVRCFEGFKSKKLQRAHKVKIYIVCINDKEGKQQHINQQGQKDGKQ